jgi:triosephosphate isomerase
MNYLIANWKMQLDEEMSESLAADIVRRVGALAAENEGLKIVVCPSHESLDRVGKAVKGTPVALGSQDCFWETKGAYTGEISPSTLKKAGCEFCIVGHSERRQHLGETDEMVNKKAKALLEQGMVPIICVGETMEERRAGKRDSVVISQVRKALEGIRLVSGQTVVVAYEPRWVIGSGKAVDPEDASSMHSLIRETLEEIAPGLAESQCTVIYGGSVDPSNLAAFLAAPLVQGVLVGGASLRAEEFAKLAEIAAADVDSRRDSSKDE